MYQQIILIGHLGDDPELRHTADNVPVCSFSLAVNKQWNRDGEQGESTTWFRVTAWRRQAEVAAQFLRRGRQVLVIGEVKPPHAYLNRLGEPAASLEVTAQTLKFLGPDQDTELEATPVQGRLLAEADIPF
ncbi:MAG TPA: single-stranded DNA-binding protein [Caldilineaceae bacterium]|nr:single-stranded DNA-binding protein [Caldilineaceae bacterium]